MKKSDSITKQIADPLQDYKAAIQKHLKISKKDFEVRQCEEGSPVLLKFRNKFFQIDSYSDLRKYAKDVLTMDILAMHIPVEIWVDIAEDVHLSPKFILNLFSELKDQKEYEQLNLALNISNNVSQSGEVFWNCLCDLGEVGLYPKGIVAACKTYDLEVMVDELMEAILSYPEHLISHMEGDFFERIELKEQEESGDNVFYLYHIDPVLWNVV